MAAGLGSDIPALPTKGGYYVDEALLELVAPLFSDRPFLQLIEFNAPARFSDYSPSGSTMTFKAGVNRKPIKDLRLRGSWSEGFRASIRRSSIPVRVARPARSRPIAPRRACRLATSRTIRKFPVITGCNENLKPETSKGRNLGAVYSPAFIPRFSLEANHYNINVKGAIQEVNANTTLQQCVVNNDAPACALITRTSSGQIANIQGLFNNIVAIETEGLDLIMTYRSPKMSWARSG